ncbi:MAG TPA: pyruvate ferredoxin oxidoreductase [Candidatus Angelobacter sp.]|jgi:pyruvate ferredoxin oxidoreductase alpha subunit|nr:pyruvate ferredoxin oxidoreductase [Candidatus Angelobacter sp.]
MAQMATLVEEQKKTEETALITGSEAIAVACKLADVDVITAYPIRPYDTVMQYVAKLVANGEMDCEYIVAEGEHSQFEIVKHASACGARVFCGSSGVGWMYAMEALTVTPALRIPMIAMVGNRALDDPGAFGVEHNDALAVRDLGWLLVWVDTAQEALDTALIAYRVAEDRRIFLPCALSCDGAFLTHSQALVTIPSQEKVNEFLPPYNRADLLLHPDNPITVAPQGNEDWVMEIRRQNYAAMERTYGVIEQAYKDFEKIFGRSYGNPFFEEYMTEDADIVLMGMGTLSTPVKVAIRQMRKEGKKVGFVRMRWFRPFAAEALAKCLGRFRAVGVIDRDYSMGSPYLGGVLVNDVRGALYSAPGKKPPVLGFIAGLGGREVTVPDVERIAAAVYQAADGKPQPLTQWIGLRE